MALKILKAAEGAEVPKTRKDLKATIEAGWDGYTDLQKADIKALRESYINYQKSDPGMFNRDARRLEKDFYKRVLQIVNGETGYSPSDASVARKNDFGYYSNSDIASIGNNITYKYFNPEGETTAPAGTTTANTTTTTPTTTTIPLNYNFQWDANIGSDWVSTMSPNDARTSMLTGIATNLTNAANAIDSGKTVRWGNLPNPLSKETAQRLALELTNLSKTNWDDVDAARTATNSVRNIYMQLGISPSEWSRYFTFDQTPQEKVQQAIKDLGYDTEILSNDARFDAATLQYLSNNKIHIYQNKDGNMRAFTEQGTPYGNIWHLNSDYNQLGLTDGYRYGYGIYSDANGDFYYGDMLPGANFSKENRFFEPIRQRIEQENERNAANYILQESAYDPTFYTGGSEELNSLYDTYFGNPDSINARNSLGVSNMSNYMDASPYFSGDKKVIAMNVGNKPFTVDMLGRPVFNNNTLFFYQDKDGVWKNTTIKDTSAIGTYNINGWGEEVDQLGMDNSIHDLRINNIPTDSFLLTSDHLKDLGTEADAAIKFIAYMTNPQNMDIEDKIRFEKLTGNGDPKQLRKMIVWLNNLVASGKLTITPNLRPGFQYVMQQYYKSDDATSSQEKGGIITAKQGTILDGYGNAKNLNITPAQQQILNAEEYNKETKLRAKDKGYDSVSKYEQNQEIAFKGWKNISSSDMLAVGSLCADIISMASGIASGTGVGAAISLGSGLASTGMSFANDWKTDGLDWGDIGRLALNVGMDFGALFTGGATKIGKIAATAAKLAPLVIGGFMLLQNGQQYVDIYNKLVRKEKLSIDEVKTLVSGVSLLAGTSRTIAHGVRMRKIKNDMEAHYTADDKIVPMLATDVSGKKVVKNISPKDAEAISKPATYEEANALFKIAVGDENVNLVPDKKGVFKKKTSTENPAKNYEAIIDNGNLAAKYGSLTETQKYVGDKNGWLASDADRALGNTGFFGLRRSSYNPYKDGGKLERLQAYINSK